MGVLEYFPIIGVLLEYPICGASHVKNFCPGWGMAEPYVKPIQFSGGPLTRNGLKSTAQEGVHGLYQRRHEHQLERGKDKTIAKRKKKLPLSPETKPVLAPVTPAIIPLFILAGFRDNERSGDVRNIWHGEYIYEYLNSRSPHLKKLQGDTSGQTLAFVDNDFTTSSLPVFPMGDAHLTLLLLLRLIWSTG